MTKLDERIITNIDDDDEEEEEEEEEEVYSYAKTRELL